MHLWFSTCFKRCRFQVISDECHHFSSNYYLLPLLTCANFMVIVILFLFFFLYFGLIISLLACKFLESRDNDLLSFHVLQFSVKYLTHIMLMTNMTTECTKYFEDQHLLIFYINSNHLSKYRWYQTAKPSISSRWLECIMLRYLIIMSSHVVIIENYLLSAYCHRHSTRTLYIWFLLIFMITYRVGIIIIPIHRWRIGISEKLSNLLRTIQPMKD